MQKEYVVPEKLAVAYCSTNVAQLWTEIWQVAAHNTAQVKMGWSGIVLVTRPVTSVFTALTPAAACGLQNCRGCWSSLP